MQNMMQKMMQKMMQNIVLFFLMFPILVSTVWSQKELIPDFQNDLKTLLNDTDITELLKDPDLWYVLKKRLGTGVLPDEPDDNCQKLKILDGSIIKTKLSLDAGAVFIAAPTITDVKECKEECCRQKSCNTAVVKFRGNEPACYLFDCHRPNVCIFDQHSSFYTIQFSQKGSSESSKDHASQLRILASSADTSTTTLSSQPRSSQMLLPVPLLGSCSKSADCRSVNGNAVCTNGFCNCSAGYHIIEDNCRKDCNGIFEFECANIDRPTLSECIAIYDRCGRDGVPQCADASDEINCPTTKGRKINDKTTAIVANDQEENSGTHKPLVAHETNSSSSLTTTVKSIETSSSPSVLGTSSTPPTELQTRLSSPASTTTLAFDDVIVEKILPWSMPVNRGAVIALTLGIVMTSILLILVVCRVRHFRKRSRKARHLGGNDADYLINGMYL